ncbi:MAG: flagellar export protein FliJ [Candidatus Omnitrophica bacterium]|nr:flagellar export protein FliJ [Candidatus Omnitrophota bacterium]
MKAFRFRLDPVIRLKEYQIEQLEDEIGRIERLMQQLTREIEAGRQAVQELRRHLLDEVEDRNLVQAHRALDLFRAYTGRMERQKQEQIERLRAEQDTLRRRLIELHRQEKILDHLKERRRAEWLAGERREEAAFMDEIGTQKFARRREEHGGVLLYLIVPLALAATVIGIGLFTGVVDQNVWRNLPYIKKAEQTATETAAPSPASTPAGESLTVEQMIGSLDTPMPELLKNIAEVRESLRQWEQQLTERERDLTRREALIDEKEAALAELTKQASDYLNSLRELKRERDEREKSELTKREEDLAKALSGAKAKEIAPVLTNLYQAAGETDPAKVRENQRLVLRILHRYTGRALQEMFSALGKTDKPTAARIIADYANVSTAELYGLEPTPTPAGPILPPPAAVEETPSGETGTSPPAGG